MDDMNGLDEKSIKEKLLEKLIDDLDLFPMGGGDHGDMKPKVAKLEVSEMGDSEDPDQAEDSQDGALQMLKDKMAGGKMGGAMSGGMSSRFGGDDDEDQR